MSLKMELLAAGSIVKDLMRHPDALIFNAPVRKLRFQGSIPINMSALLIAAINFGFAVSGGFSEGA
jgi:hypothetical protein